MINVGFNFVVAGARNTGAREYLSNLLEELLQLEGPEHYTIYLRRDEPESTIERFRDLASDARCVRTPLPMVPTHVRVLRGAAYWPRQLRRDRIDVFHHTYFPLPLGLGERKVVLTLYDLIQRGMPEAFTRGRRWFTNATQPGAFRRADRIAVISEAVVDDLARFHPRLDLGKVEIVPCAVDESYIEHGQQQTDPEMRAQVREKYTLPDRFILGVGHLEPRKNWSRLIAAYARMRERLGESAPRLVIVGVENWDFHEIYNAAEAARVRPFVSFTGYVEPEHLPEVYSLAEVFAYPSLYEGFGIPVLEAMASGVPVLTSNTTSLPEVSGGAAYLVDPYSVESIASGLERLATSPQLRQELIERGHANVRRYSWRQSARRMQQIYHDLAGVTPMPEPVRHPE